MQRTLAGIHAVKHALEAGEAVDQLLIEKGKQHPRLNELIHLARKAGIRVSFVPKEQLQRLAAGVPHQGVVAELATAGVPAQGFEQWLEALDVAAGPLVLLLDQVTDPHNLGACVRTAEAAGCAGVIIPKDNAADLNSPVVAKSACGALSRLPVMRVTNLTRSIEALQKKGFWVIGLAGESERMLYDVKLTGAMALVMGSEGEGLRRLVREACDELVGIPMPGTVESLNVSVATGVALFEAVRQRRSQVGS
ncbi:MAG TPA: 23S rRNA (guanosine(2251)-2'-O)-methyltransferase RlmB [Mariprofundaceae bacterium]|nr:23S rRNA (guanosine(2251)-2'-O)-methyltransferase RlmB [Mariprofundaceae bacterium]